MKADETRARQQTPVILTETHANEHPLAELALVPIPGRLVRAIYHFLYGLTQPDATGTLYRGIDALLLAVDDGDETVIDDAVREALKGWIMRKQSRPEIMKW